MSAQCSIEIYQLRILFKEISPIIWRRLLITDQSSLADLHYAIQIIIGWNDIYLHQFDIWGKNYGLNYEGGLYYPDNARKVYLKDFQFRINEKFVYEYNFFNHWQFEIRLEKKSVPVSHKQYPLCIGGKYAAPPEDCGGALTFMKLKSTYTNFDIKMKLYEALEHYEEDKDYDAFQETIKELHYWANRHLIELKNINRKLRYYFDNPEKDQLTIEEVHDED